MLKITLSIFTKMKRNKCESSRIKIGSSKHSLVFIVLPAKSILGSAVIWEDVFL